MTGEFVWVALRRLAGRERPGLAPLLSRGDLTAALWAAGAMALVVQLWRHRLFLVDDTYVSLRYAANWLSHGELAWNLGERVEGFTNLLHLLAGAALGAVGLDLVTAVHVVNGAALALLLGAAWQGARLLAPGDGLARAVGGALLLGAPQLAIWVWGGLEAVAVAALVTLGMVLVLGAVLTRRKPDLPRLLLAGMALAAAGATRPDAFLFTAAAALALLAVDGWPLRARLLAGMALAVLPTLCAAGLTAWRLSYYGDIVPNTLHAKTAFDIPFRLSGGMRYLLLSLLQAPVLLAAGAMVGLARGRLPWPVLLLGGSTALYLLYVLWVGGDYMAGARMLVPVFGLASLLLVERAAALEDETQRHWSAVALLAVVTLGVALPPQRMEPAAHIGRIVGEHIARAWPKDALVAVNCVGSTPYFAPEHRFVDMLGLNDRTVAKREITTLRLQTQTWPGHAKGDGAYVLSRKPDYIIPGPADGMSIDQPWFLSDAELADLPEFHRCYVLETAQVTYDPAYAAIAKVPRPNPLVLTYYRRVCGEKK